MKNDECLNLFEKYLTDVKKSSVNTLSSYMRDIRQLGEYLDTRTDALMDTAGEEELADRKSTR